ncbi:CotH kinase family protein [Barnesiella sp.]|uniref:CotH kinase family protein n=1 Tax=Barnesiella sp. TaxID=2033407 RepID=UPI0025879E98|nr:CotH kinase family protein [Barnesiella sp.]
MANDIDKTSPHYKGEFGSIYEVNQKFPSGGVEGDYVAIDGWAHYWNADRGTWCVNAQRDSYWDELITGIIEKFKLIKGATYMGVAGLDTVPAKVIGAKMYYFATVAGTYKNFGGLVVPQGINVLYSENGSSWVCSTLLEVAQELGVSTRNVVSQKVVNEALAKKANTADVDTKFTEEKKRVDAELAKKFDKENIAQEFGDSKDKVVSQFAIPFREIESPEFIKVIVDAEDHFLFGIQLDGSIEWSKGIPAPIRAKLQEIINQCQQDKTDILEAINAAKKELSASITALQEGKVDKEEGKSLIEDEVKECFRVIENEEFIKAIVDAEDRVLFGIYRATGKPYYPQNDMYHISQSEEFLWVILDAANHPLLGILQDGTCWAAKPQWLDDIKAIKEALSSIDETLKNFQPKEDGKGLISLDVADSFFYISNDEYIIAVVDTENRILAGIKYDAQPYFPNHEMYSVITNEEWLYAIIDAENKVLGGFHANDGHMFVGGIDISTFISDAIIDIADIKERTAHLSTIENDEYLSVETDAEGKVIGYTAPDGSHYFYKVKSETIPIEFEHIEDPEKRMEITTDREGKVMSYRDSQGKKHEHDMEVTNLEVSNLNLQGNSVYNIQDALKANGFTIKTPADWSEYITQNGDYPLNIPTPRCARLNIISSSDLTKLSKVGLAGAVKGKNYDIPAVVEFWDMQGNYFKKNSYISGQGSSSMNYIKKSIALDLFDSEVGGDSFSVKFGEWVPQDSFHLKAYYTDPFRGMCVIGYSIYNDIVKTRGLEKDYVWKRALLNTDAITPTNPIVNGKKEVLLYTESGARCFPDGFPCMVFQNGEFWGLYSFQLKKHRSNYCLNKKTAEHIHLDGNISETSLFNANGDSSLIQWKNINKVGFEIRNPKSLYLMDGSEYDADLNSGELIDESSEFYDELKHKTSAKVKKYIIDFSKTLATIKAAEDVYLGNKTDENLKAIKDTLETYFDSENLIDYLITCDLLRNTDGFADNWQWVTYNGVKWYVCLYDVDATLGNHWQPVQTINPPLYGKHVTQIISKISMMKYITTYYVSELEERYAYLRKNGIIDAERIVTKIRDWMLRFGGQYAYELEANKWTDFVKNDNIFRVHKWLITEINNLDKVYHYNSEV